MSSLDKACFWNGNCYSMHSDLSLIFFVNVALTLFFHYTDIMYILCYMISRLQETKRRKDAWRK